MQVKTEKKVYTPFPPPQAPSKIDQQLESGEFFLSAGEKKEKRQAEKSEENKAHKVINVCMCMCVFVYICICLCVCMYVCVRAYKKQNRQAESIFVYMHVYDMYTRVHVDMH